MWSEQDIQNYLMENLKIKRYEHSLSVRDTAVELAKIYGADVEKAKIAGLVHDCAKNMSDEKILDIAEKHGLHINEICKENPQLLHGSIAAIIAEEKMGITDNCLLNAVTYHTTGKKCMTVLEKILYVADYVEPLRNFTGVEILRAAAYEDLDKALLIAFDNTIKFVIEKGQLIHLDTIEGRNFMISKFKNK